MTEYVEVLKKYTVFSGRAARREFWMFFLVHTIIVTVLTAFGKEYQAELLAPLYSLAVFLPNVGVGIRRLHDTNHSGWWWLIVLVPLLGFIVLIVFWAQDSRPGANAYGPNPKGA